MSDINKLVAAILTAGRVPTLSDASGPRGTADWLAEYDICLKALDERDRHEGADLDKTLEKLLRS